MAVGTGTLVEIRLEAGELVGRVSCPPTIRPAPGQYLVASSPHPVGALPVVLFPQRILPDGLEIAAPLPEEWNAGLPLALRGPLGNGFRLPANAQRVALAGLEGGAARLLPLARLALDQGAAVVVYTGNTPVGLPAEVEILSLDLLPEAQAWADFLAVEVSLAGLPALRQWLGLKPFQKPACQTQVLLWTALPCTGLAECGICAVEVKRGWALVCADGPVFDFNDLDGV
jgi:NAD(P)H-flavin reductase